VNKLKELMATLLTIWAGMLVVCAFLGGLTMFILVVNGDMLHLIYLLHSGWIK
jgi:hypothetical protein